MPVDRTQIAIFVSPLVPDGHAVLFQVLDVRVTGNEPQQFVYDRLQMNLLGSQQRKAFREVKPHLVTENALCADTRAVMFDDSVFPYVAKQVKILFHNKLCSYRECKDNGLLEHFTRTEDSCRELRLIR